MKVRMIVGMLVLALLAAVTVGLGQAQGTGPGTGDQPEGATDPAGVEEIVTGDIPIQGRLTDADGNPVPDGVYEITFRLYDAGVDGNLLCVDTVFPTVTDGLFTALFSNCTADDINGQGLWLEIQADGDDPMTPRQQIAPVPYAWSLRPGAVIEGDVPDDSVLQATNLSQSNGSKGVYGLAGGLAATNYGVYGASLSAFGYGGYFVGATAMGNGVALKAAGSGIIQSTANSYLWISGNSLQKANSDDTTRWEYDDYGGYRVYGGADWGSLKRVVLPVTIPGQLYGQNITVTGLDLYYTELGEFTGINAVIVRRQDGVGTGNLILYDDTIPNCSIPAQCVEHWDLTQNNELSDQRGVLHIVLRFAYGSDSDYIQIGGVRLTLEHD